MATTQDVLNLLATQHPEWAAATLRFDPTETMLLDIWLRKGHTPQQAADLIWAKVQRGPSADPVDNITGLFGVKSHAYILNLLQALGIMEEDLPAESMPPARTAAEALALARQGWYWNGETKFLDLSTEQGKTAFAAREERAKNPPDPWKGIDSDLVYLLTVSDLLGQENPKHYRGFTLQMWLDNQWAIRNGQTAPWEVK